VGSGSWGPVMVADDDDDAPAAFPDTKLILPRLGRWGVRIGETSTCGSGGNERRE